jgi:hypothetical protein
MKQFKKIYSNIKIVNVCRNFQLPNATNIYQEILGSIMHGTTPSLIGSF